MLTPNPSPDTWEYVSKHTLAKKMGGHAWIEELVPLLSDQVPVVEDMFEMSLLDGRTVESLLADAREVEMMRNLENTRKLEQILHSTESLQQRMEEVEKQSQLDALTGLHNRGYLDQKIEENFNQAVDCGWPISVVFVDIDFFKQINDNYGHDVGDYVLQEAAQLMIETTRDTDIVGRYGGEEFIILLPGVDTASAKRVAERLVDAFRNAEFSYGEARQIKLTISAGVATNNSNTSFKHQNELVRAADHAMYAAKQKGRDRFIFAAA